jgi:hypothetical protein
MKRGILLYQRLDRYNFTLSSRRNGRRHLVYPLADRAIVIAAERFVTFVAATVVRLNLVG